MASSNVETNEYSDHWNILHTRTCHWAKILEKNYPFFNADFASIVKHNPSPAVSYGKYCQIYRYRKKVTRGMKKPSLTVCMNSLVQEKYGTLRRSKGGYKRRLSCKVWCESLTCAPRRKLHSPSCLTWEYGFFLHFKRIPSYICSQNKHIHTKFVFFSRKRFSSSTWSHQHLCIHLRTLRTKELSGKTDKIGNTAWMCLFWHAFFCLMEIPRQFHSLGNP